MRDDEKDTGDSAVSNTCVHFAGEGGQLYSLLVPLRGSFRVLRTSYELCTSGGARASEVGNRTCRTPALEQDGEHEHWWRSAPAGLGPHAQELVCDMQVPVLCLHGGHMSRERGLHICLGHPMVGARERDLVLPVYSLLVKGGFHRGPPLLDQSLAAATTHTTSTD